jgi:hypothetical protein
VFRWPRRLPALGWQLQARRLLPQRPILPRQYPTGKCLPCYQRCLGCVGTGRYNCTACQPNHYLFKGTCIPNCPVGYFYSQDLDDCILCHPTCKYCVNPKATSCTACYNTGVNKGWLNKDRTCTMPCKDNYYMAPDQRCKICDQSCFALYRAFLFGLYLLQWIELHDS